MDLMSIVEVDKEFDIVVIGLVVVMLELLI